MLEKKIFEKASMSIFRHKKRSGQKPDLGEIFHSFN